MNLRPDKVLIAVCLLLPAVAGAHSFGVVYNLPVPVWMYLYGSAAALAVSFVVVGYFVSSSKGGQNKKIAEFDLRSENIFRPFWDSSLTWFLMSLLKLISILGLCLCIVTGLWGSKNPYGNFNMTFFWIVFVLGFTYATAVFGNLYAAINPWKTLSAAISRLYARFDQGLITYPERLGYTPALLLYMAFIWLELFGQTDPWSLAVILTGYSAMNLLGVLLIGSRAWFRYCEFFGLFLRLTALMAPVEYHPPEQGKSRAVLKLRMPFVGLLKERTAGLSMLLFVLFMLSSTAFDGLHETTVWRQLFWVDLYQSVLSDRVGKNIVGAYPIMRKYFIVWQNFWLFASPFIYLLVYMLFMEITRWCTGRRISLKVLCLEFGLTLLPIALVYNVTHYYTLIQTQGIKIVKLASDPFGKRWDLFGTADWFNYNIIPDPETVWHVQVGLIVLGHIISVYLAHRVALRLFETQRQAVISQLPMLVLMVLFTTVGLWILSQPIQVRA